MPVPTLLHVLHNRKTKKSHRLVLIEIANHVHDDHGLAWPMDQTLANKTGLVKLLTRLQALKLGLTPPVRSFFVS